MKGTVYLLHFDRKIAHAGHYLGFAEELGPRLNAHRHGKGARLTQVAGQREIGFELVRAWEGSRSDERRLKNRKNAPRLCPYCNERPQKVGLVEIVVAPSAHVQAEIKPNRAGTTTGSS